MKTMKRLFAILLTAALLIGCMQLSMSVSADVSYCTGTTNLYGLTKSDRDSCRYYEQQYKNGVITGEEFARLTERIYAGYSDMTWTYSSGTLYINGKGVIEDSGLEYALENAGVESPRSKVKHIELGDDITGIGSDVFNDFDNIISLSSRVEEIGDSAFRDCDFLSFYTYAKTIGDDAFSSCSFSRYCNPVEYAEEIGDYAFHNCTFYEPVEFSSRLKKIGKEAFAYSYLHTNELTIPSSVLEIGSAPFIFTDVLAFRVEAANPNYYSDESGVLYTKDGKTLIAFPVGAQNDSYSETGLTSYTIPQGVETIGDYAFYDAELLQTITIPQGVVTIGISAFENTGLTQIDLPNTVQTIGSNAFNSTPLTSVTIPDSVRSIGSHAFYSYNSNVRQIDLGNGVQSIGSSAFGGTVDNLTIPASLTNIENAFEGLTTSSFTVDADNPKYYDQNGLLMQRDTATLVRYPIGDPATAFTIPDGTVSIGNSAFQNTNLTQVNIPLSVRTIESGAFEYSNLTQIHIPSSVRTIASFAFYNSTKLKTVTIEYGVQSIGYCAFSGLPITQIVLPDSVTSLSSDAFSGCSQLQWVHVPSDLVYSYSSDLYWLFRNVKDHICCESTEGGFYDLAVQKGYNCTICDGSHAVHTTHEHQYVNVVTEPTCTTDGYTTHTCSICDRTYKDEEIPALGHDYVITKETQSTFDTGGVTIQTCTRCGKQKKTHYALLFGLDVEQKQAYQGDTVEVSVTMHNNPGLWFMGVSMQYDPQKLTLTNVSNGEFLQNMTDVDDTTPGIVSAQWYKTGSDTLITPRTGTLVTYTFRIAQDAQPGQTALQLSYDPEHTGISSECYPLSSYPNSSDLTLVDGYVNVFSNIPGDNDGDGELNLKDVTTIIRYIIGGWDDPDPALRNADVNGDGAVNLKDAAILRRYLAGWDVTLQ